MNYIEIFGYLASLTALISWSVKGIVKMRIINLIACFMFIIYASLIGSMPFLIINIAVAIIQIYNLIKHKIQCKRSKN